MKELKQKVLEETKNANTMEELESVGKKYLGRKGELTKILRALKDLSEDEKKQKGREANQLKKDIDELINSRKEELRSSSSVPLSKDWIDVTAPGTKMPQGHLHPMTLVQRQVESIFQSMGFFVADGPEIELEKYNFDALNIPKDHPARDVWDTFWLKDIDLLLRTHTSPVQARYMESHKPPLRIIAPGRCYRHEATDATHEANFAQVEGLMVGEDISIANFKGVIEGFLKQFFGEKTEMRLIPSYFPFVEPGFQIDIKRSGKEGWLELMGAGMVHPNVFKAVGYEKGKWQGFAFGFGLERMTVLKYKMKDIRMFYEGNMKFLKQF